MTILFLRQRGRRRREFSYCCGELKFANLQTIRPINRAPFSILPPPLTPSIISQKLTPSMIQTLPPPPPPALSKKPPPAPPLPHSPTNIPLSIFNLFFLLIVFFSVALIYYSLSWKGLAGTRWRIRERCVWLE